MEESLAALVELDEGESESKELDAHRRCGTGVVALGAAYTFFRERRAYEAREAEYPLLSAVHLVKGRLGWAYMSSELAKPTVKTTPNNERDGLPVGLELPWCYI